MRRATTNPWLALSALCFGFFMILLDTTIVNVAIPAMLTGLDASLNEINWVNSVYLLTYAVPLLLAARLGDRFGPRRLFVAGLVIFTGASLWCGLAPTAADLIAARAVQGLGAAALTPQTLSYITHLFPRNRGAAMGVWGAVAGVATVAGPVLGGVLVETLGWEWIFFVNVPIGVVGVVVTLALVPDWRPGHSHRWDPLGIALSSAGMFALVFGIQNGQRYGWGTVAGPVTIIEILAAGVLLLAAFVVWQRRGRGEPLLPLQVFRHRAFAAGSLTNISIGFALTGMFYPLTIYMQSVLGLTPLQAGLLAAPMSILSGVVAPFAGHASDRMDGRYAVIFGLIVFAAGLLSITWLARPHSDPLVLMPGLLAAGLGVGCVFSPLSNSSMSALPRPLVGTGSGIFNTARQVGGVLGSAGVGVLLQARLEVALPEAARQRAADLPADLRAEFVAQLGRAAGSANEFGAVTAGPALPPGLPADVVERVRQTATEVFQLGFTEATRETLLLPSVVLLLGMLCAAGMRAPQPAATPARAVPATSE